MADHPKDTAFQATLIASDPLPAKPDAVPATQADSALAFSAEPSRTGGQRLAGRYEILGLIGVGGMGTVYRAHDLELDEVVALKVVNRALLDSPGVLVRFKQEAKFARRVTHYNVARTFDVGEHEGERFLTMELIEGSSLASLLAREGAFHVARVIAIARSLCAGLAAAHAAGVVHRDLKPENVIISPATAAARPATSPAVAHAIDGERVVITDFGIARAFVEVGASHTMGMILGTPAYMAPEQVEARPDIDQRADLYALGEVIYEMLTGRAPWQGDSAFAVAAARLISDPPDPRVLAPQLPAALAGLVVRLMARKREDRYAHATEVDAVLALIVEDLPTRAGTDTVSSGSFRAAQRPGAGRLLAAKTGRDERTVAVLPFRNGGPAEDDYVADGLTEDLIDMLSMTRGLRVRPHGVTMSLKGKEGDPRELGRNLQVHVVVDGSVRKTTAGYRFTVRLISVADGYQLWAQRFDLPAGDLLSANDRIAHAVAAALTTDIDAPTRPAPHDAAAVDLYLRARGELRKAWYSPGRLSAAAAMFEQALVGAPDDPAMLAEFALACGRIAFFGGTAGDDAMKRARRAAERAVAAAPHCGEAWVALATVHANTNRAADAVSALNTALSVSPALAKAHEVLGRMLLDAGEIERAIARMETAIALDPSSVEPQWDLARAHALVGDWARCDALLDVRVTDDASRAMRDTSRARFVVWRRSARSSIAPPSRDVESTVQSAPVVGEPAPDRVGRMFAHITATGTLAPDHRRELEQTLVAIGENARLRPLVHQFYAEALFAIGDAVGGQEQVSLAIDAGLLDLSWIDRCPLLKPIRSTPEWPALRARMAARNAEVLARLDVGS